MPERMAPPNVTHPLPYFWTHESSMILLGGSVCTYETAVPGLNPGINRFCVLVDCEANEFD